MSRPWAPSPSCGCLACGPQPAARVANEASLRVLVGVLSAPRGAGAQRRRAIRATWTRWPDIGDRLFVCFVLGRRGLPRRTQRALDGRDVLWVDTEEIGVLSIPKVFAWWAAAAAAADRFTHFVKVDDDSFVHVPNLLGALEVAGARANGHLASAAPRPHRHLCLGALAYAGYAPQPRFRMCGWSWQRGLGNWHARKCGPRGFTRPFPFPLGALQALSSGVVRALGTSRDVDAFATAANASADLRARDSNEDVALGYWLRRLRGEGSGRPWLNVSFVSINRRVPNLGCFRNAGLYRQPAADAIVIHRIKGAAGIPYVWRVLRDGLPHDPINCSRDAGVELPRGALVFTPDFEARVRAGLATVDFDQKTNRLTMRFTGPRSAGRDRGLGR